MSGSNSPHDRPYGPVDRGISVPLSHAMTLAITSVVVAGLVASAGGLLSDEREQAVGTELSTIGVDLVSTLEAVDRLAAGENTTATLEVSYPGRVAGRTYLVSLSAPADCGVDGRPVACVSLLAPESGVERTVPFRNVTPVENGSATGGDLLIEHRDGSLTVLDRP